MMPLPPARVPLGEAPGLALAEPIDGPHDIPPFANSAMDGFAVRAADTAGGPVTLEILEDVPAGSTPVLPVGPGKDTRIMTGAPMPEGAEAVVMVEDTSSSGNRVQIGATVAGGASVRAAGGDLRAGERVFDAGERLGPARLGVLASIGVTAPVVRRRPRVAILSTGDEVLEAETEVLPPGTREALFSGGLPKGDARAVARVAAIQGVKRTSDLVPLCHPIPLTGVDVDITETPDGARIEAKVRTTAPTGVEMEAMTGAALGAITIYDMVEGLERGAEIGPVRLLAKSGGRSGEWTR